jgi:hypothetical protein
MFYVPEFHWSGNTKLAIEAEFEVCETFADYVSPDNETSEDFVVYECNSFDDDGLPVDITKTWIITVYKIRNTMEFSWYPVDADYVAKIKRDKEYVLPDELEAGKLASLVRHLNIGASGVKS